MKYHCLKNADNFRVKLALSLISQKGIEIVEIRHRSMQPGVTNAEVSLLRLIDEISNGTMIKINDTGTVVRFKPGILIGGNVDFDCGTERGIGYYVEFLLLVAPFCKEPSEIRLRGVTNIKIDPSTEMIKQAWLPVYRCLIGASAAASLKLDVIKRGPAPLGGGEVLLVTKPSSAIFPVTKLSFGKVYRVRGLAWSCRVSSGYGYKVIAGAKSVINKYLSDVYITMDHCKSETAGLSPGFGITLWAETKDEAVYSAEAISEPQGPDAEPVDAEAVGRSAANRLLDQIFQGGFVDAGAQSLTLVLMACEGGRNANQLAVGPLSTYSITTLRLVQQILGVTFHFDYRKPSSIHRIYVQSMKENDKKTTPETTNVSGDVSHEAFGADGEKGEDVSTPDLLIATCFGSGAHNIGRAVR
ncbi:RNA 3'-terminal phosphate cyclase [Fasciolopsis buskii]|uniref:RNA 3'-terminal phosphate cyclase n=1 Tax=Fasciolopsis buskii TaxID=27845 RepID=A0A8E0RX27_9TREM|nr:RNA 3'-terminal phosphate cyclase [Fasciolopsis buski]